MREPIDNLFLPIEQDENLAFVTNNLALEKSPKKFLKYTEIIFCFRTRSRGVTKQQYKVAQYSPRKKYYLNSKISKCLLSVQSPLFSRQHFGDLLCQSPLKIKKIMKPLQPQHHRSKSEKRERPVRIPPARKIYLPYICCVSKH